MSPAAIRRAANVIPAPSVSLTPSDRRTILAPPSGYEQVIESSIVNVGGTWYLSYTRVGPAPSGTSGTGVAVLSAPSLLGPWTDHGIQVGQGNGGESGVANSSWMMVDSGTVYLFYVNSDGGSLAGGFGQDLFVANGADPLHLTKQAGSLLHYSSLGGSAGRLYNMAAINDGGTWRFLVETLDDSSGFYQMGYCTSTGPTSPLTVVQYPLPSLKVGAFGMYGGPWLTKQGSTFVCWYHATALPSDPGTYYPRNQPTQIYRATSTDMVNWTPNPTPQIGRTKNPLEFDQVADAFLVLDPTVNQWRVFMEGVDNLTPAASLELWLPTLVSA